MAGTPAAAGLAYGVGAFAAGFVLGTIRVILVTPAVGTLAATAIEIPLMLAVSWWLCGRLVARFAVPAALSARLVMGGVAALALGAGEALLGLAVGRSLADQGAALLAPAGLLGLAGQIAFALLPVALLAVRPRPR